MTEQHRRYALSLILILLACPALQALQTPDAAKKPAGGFEISAAERDILALVNKERSDQGLTALRPNEKLFKAAREHSANMAKQGQLSHDLDGKGPGERLDELGYRHGGWGENCAVHQRTAEQLVATWMNSPGHKANILNGGFTEAGIGSANDRRGVPYHTLVLATPSGAPAGPTRQAASQPKAARLIFRMPADATLHVEDHLLRPGDRAGGTRTLDTPPIPAGQDFVYTVRAELTRENAVVTVRKQVRFRAGSTVEVDLSALETLVGGKQPQAGSR